MRLVTLNIRHGGGRHTAALATALLRQRADLLVLSEFRNNRHGEALRNKLAASGFTHQATAVGDARLNTLLVAARLPFSVQRQRVLAFDPVRLMEVRFSGFALLAAHLPNLKAKIPHWKALLRLARAEPAARRILAGDFNTGENGADGENFRFTCADEMARLLALGWVDAWRRLHPSKRDYTWYSHRGRGFRLDHVFLSPALAPALRGAALSHRVRLRGLTDHSALRVDLAL